MSLKLCVLHFCVSILNSNNIRMPSLDPDVLSERDSLRLLRSENGNLNTTVSIADRQFGSNILNNVNVKASSLHSHID